MYYCQEKRQKAILSKTITHTLATQHVAAPISLIGLLFRRYVHLPKEEEAAGGDDSRHPMTR